MKKGAKFPGARRLATMRRRLSSSKVLGSAVLPAVASEVERTKFKVCEMIIRFRHASGLNQAELAKRLGIDAPRMSEILHYKVERFTLDRLMGYAIDLYPGMKLQLRAA